MIISTRENQQSRERVLHLGISQISGGSRTSVGGYCEPEPEDENRNNLTSATPGHWMKSSAGLWKWIISPASVLPVTGKAVPVTASCRCVKVDRSRTAATQMP